MLEARVLLAGDVCQNPDNVFDVNNDGTTSPMDALMFSLLSSNRAAGEPIEADLSGLDLSPTFGSGTLSTLADDVYMDVDGNGIADMEDYEAVVDALNAASGEPGDVVTFNVRTTDLDGNEITSIDVGDEFLLTVFAQDTQTDPDLLDTGVFAAYLDVEYNAALATVTGDLEFSSNFPNQNLGDISTPGIIDEAGGFSGGTVGTGQGEFEVFSLRLRADAPGGLTFTSNPADLTPNNDVLVFGSNERVDENDILYGSATLTINGDQDPQQDLVGFAEALADAGVQLWTSTFDARGDAAEQLDLFQEGQHFLPVNELFEVVTAAASGDPNVALNQAAIDAGRSTPNIWIFPDGSESDGSLLTLEEISTRAGVPIPTSVGPSLVPIDDVTVLNGAPLQVALDGYDPNGDVLTYTVTVGDADLLETTVLSGNRSVRFTNTEDGVYLGDTVFELFEGRAPRATDRVIELAESGFYEGITYHRVINDFVIQAGDPTGTGAGGSDLGDFDDQFHVDLQHTGTGLLSQAKTDDDTNDSQFFVTEGPSRHLDFNHTIFGFQTEGERVRDTISNVPNDGSVPVTPVVIESAEIFEDTQNAVLMLSGLEDVGTTTVTVTATDVNGNTTTQTFEVTLGEDTDNGAPFLEDFEDQVFEPGEPVEFQVGAIDVEGDPVQFEAFINSTEATIEIDDEGNVTAGGFIGTLEALIRVTRADDAFSGDEDTQFFMITINTDGPTEVNLVDSSDAGFLDDDDLTNLSELQFEVSGVFDGATVIVTANGDEIGRADATGETVIVTTNTPLTGEQDIRAVIDLGDELSAESPRLVIDVDQTLPDTINNVAPTTANVGEEYTFDAEHDDEANIVYSLANAPDGLTIDSATGEISWTPTGSQAGAQTFQILVGDDAGNNATTTVTVNVAAGTAELSVAAVDADGNQIAAVGEGTEFFLEVYIEDQRGNPSGVEEARVSVLFDPALASIDNASAIDVSDNFSDQQSTGTINGAGLQGVGGVSTDLAGDDRVLIATIPVTAGSIGLFEASVVSDLIVFGSGGGTAANADIESMGVTINVLAVGSELMANDDEFTVLEDSGPHVFDVLSNDVLAPDSNIVEIISNQRPSQDGAATISSDGRTIVYTPLEDSDEDEQFTYTIEDSQGNTSTATVNVFVNGTNDPPNAPNFVFPADLETSVADREQIAAVLIEDSTEEVIFNFPAAGIVEPGEGFTLTQLGNGTNARLRPIGTVIPDLSNPDEGIEGPIVVSFGYIPAANVSGEDTFSYTVQEIPLSAFLSPTLPTNGQSSSGEITVRIARVNDAPIPRTDIVEAVPGLPLTISASELLDNDSAGPLEDLEQSLSIIAVGEASSGSVELNADGSITYTPPANASGTATFTYTVQDDGQTDTVNGLELEARDDFLSATVPVTISFTNTPDNEAPQAAADSTTAVNNGQVVEIDVLRNDFDDGGSDGLTITDVTQGANGSVAIVDGQLQYTPDDAQFFGTDTFSYTITDGNFSDTAQVTVRLLDPNITTNSEVSGVVFHDADGNGVQTGGEPGFASVQVLLTGTDANGIEVNRTTTTDVNGNYRFDALAEGSYEVVQEQPLLLVDGGESASGTAAVAGDDRISLEVADTVVVSEGNSFGDTGLSARFLMLETLASHRRDEGFLTSIAPNGQSQFIGSALGWEAYTSLRVEMSDDGSQVTVVAVDGSSQEVRATVSTAERELVHLIGRDVDTDTTILRIAAPASAFDLS